MASKVLTQNDLLNVLAHINLGDDGHMELTQAEFDQLTQEEKDDGTIYFITDGVSGNVFLDDNTPIGTIAPYGGTSDPTYWLICDGRAISRTAYADLFAVIGTTYGSGNGSTTFNIPDLRGNVAVGASATYDLGDTGGEAEHTLTIDEMPSHKHEVSYRLNVVAQGTAGMWYFDAGTVGTMTTDTPSVANTGGSQAHNNMQPYVVTNYIIKAKSAVSESQSYLDMFYPVGSYYETSNSTFNPNTHWGGTWEKVEEGKFLQATTDNTKVGNSVSAGLPNITAQKKLAWGDISGNGIIMQSETNMGAFGVSGSSDAPFIRGTSTGSYNNILTFNASNSNPIYGNSTTVQPPAILVIIWHRVA